MGNSDDLHPDVMSINHVLLLLVVGSAKPTWAGAEGQVWDVGAGPLQLSQNHRRDQPVLLVGSLAYSSPPAPQINTVV